MSFSTSLFPGSTGNQGIAPGFGNFLGSFSQTMASLSIAVGDAGGDIDSLTLIGYDALDQIVDSDIFTANVGQILSNSGSGITRFEIQQVGAIVFDNIAFEIESETIPEPTAIALFGLCLAGLGLAPYTGSLTEKLSKFFTVRHLSYGSYGPSALCCFRKPLIC